MTEPELCQKLHTLIRLKYEESPQVVINRMGPTWTARAYQLLRKADDAGETITIETLWGTPLHPNLWRLNP